jgi:hypothetical protein
MLIMGQPSLPAGADAGKDATHGKAHVGPDGPSAPHSDGRLPGAEYDLHYFHKDDAAPQGAIPHVAHGTGFGHGGADLPGAEYDLHYFHKDDAGDLARTPHTIQITGTSPGAGALPASHFDLHHFGKDPASPSVATPPSTHPHSLTQVNVPDQAMAHHQSLGASWPAVDPHAGTNVPPIDGGHASGPPTVDAGRSDAPSPVNDPAQWGVTPDPPIGIPSDPNGNPTQPFTPQTPNSSLDQPHGAVLDHALAWDLVDTHQNPVDIGDGHVDVAPPHLA